MSQIPIIPGRGLVTAMSTQMRLDYLSSIGLKTDQLMDSKLDLKTVQNNIESYIGTVEIPTGIVGPLLFLNNDQEELVYCPACTLEGALVASMNRGAKVISKSGGFRAKVLWQKMSRAPLFIFERETEAELFRAFVERNFEGIKHKAESYSNHATLIELNSVVVDSAVHVRFIYTTGDASGQNMTTTCTWHAMLYLAEQFEQEYGIQPLDFVIEGNGSSDKKVSSYAAISGRGVNVLAECFVPEQVINEVLRTTSQKIEQCYKPSLEMARINGMVGCNVNIANAIAAIYAATGQDLACIHESSVGEFLITRKEGGLQLSLHLSNLVIGTVGGGTHLSKQSEALDIMKCKGSGKIERFAQLIAGFALSLEISTYAAIVSGEFAKAHEKLGRNKPVDWLLRSELSGPFLEKCLSHLQGTVISVQLDRTDLLENGIITSVASRISKKLIGFEPLVLQYQKENSEEIRTQKLLLKSKALDTEVIKGLHVIGASIDPELSDLINAHQGYLEYKNCHLKELELFTFLHKQGFVNIPQFFGAYKQADREIYILVQEFLDYSRLRLINSELHPEHWYKQDVCMAIDTATKYHRLFASQLHSQDLAHAVQDFVPWKANELYNKLIELLLKEEKDPERILDLEALLDVSLTLEQEAKSIQVPKTVVHNDYSPRNIAIRDDGQLLVYDWELAVLNYPHRDIVELLSFVLPKDFTEEQLMAYLRYHYQSQEGLGLSWNDWLPVYSYSLKEFIVTRVAFYEVAGIIVKYDFSAHILHNALKMLKLLNHV